MKERKIVIDTQKQQEKADLKGRIKDRVCKLGLNLQVRGGGRLNLLETATQKNGVWGPAEF